MKRSIAYGLALVLGRLDGGGLRDDGNAGRQERRGRGRGGQERDRAEAAVGREDPAGQAAAAAGQRRPSQAPKISASAKAEFDAAVKKWEAAKKAKGGMSRGRLQGAGVELLAHLATAALAAQAHFNAGTILESCGDDKDAESEYQAALSANPAYGPAMTNLGELYYKQNNPTTAKSWFEKAIEADPAPRRRAAYNNLGAILYQQGKQTGDRALYTQAISNLRRALAIDAYDSMAAYAPAGARLLHDRRERQLQARAGRAGLQARPKEVEQGLRAHLQHARPHPAAQEEPVAGAQGVRAGGGARSEVRRGAPQHRRHRPVDAAVREGGAAFAAVLKLDSRRTSTRPSAWAWRRAASKKIDEAESWYKKAAELDPQELRGAVQHGRPLPGLQDATPANANLNAGAGVLRPVSSAAARRGRRRRSRTPSAASRTSTTSSPPSSSRRRWRRS